MTLALPSIWDAERDEALICVAVRQETHDVSTFVFAPVEPRLFRFLPGQFMTFDLPAAGDLNGAGVQRCYTIASPPTRPWRIETTAKRSPGGAGSGWLHGAMRPGMQVQASGPMGDFVLDPAAGGRYLFLSAGSGITPLMSMARTLHDLGSDADVLFLHSARSPADLLFPEELAAMSRRPGFRSVSVVETDAPGAKWDGLRGRLSPAMLDLVAPDLLEREVFCCGPAPYMAAVRSMLDAAGFDRARYRDESFSFGDAPDAGMPHPEPSLRGVQRRGNPGAAGAEPHPVGSWIATPQAARNDEVTRMDGAGRTAIPAIPVPRSEQPSSQEAEVNFPVAANGRLLPLPPEEGRGEGVLAAARNAAGADGTQPGSGEHRTSPPPHPNPLPEGEGAGGGVLTGNAPAHTTFTIRFVRQDRHIACPGGTNVLAAARAAGIRLPSACGKGVCGTCKSRVLSGTVEMRHGGGIRQREIDGGMALLCCARPTSDLVVTQMDLGVLHRLAFLTLPNYSMIACANAIEVLRMANRLSGQTAYAWEVVTPDGTSATASNGLALHPTISLSRMTRPDLLLACGGVDVRDAVDISVTAALRRLAREGVPLGSLCTGAFALAEAGLLRGRRCAIHWENLPPIEEEFREVEFVGDLYAVDRDRVTCTGGVAPLSLMLAMVEARLGPALSAAVAAQFLVDRVRAGSERQRDPAGPAAPGKLGDALRIMESTIEAPMHAAAVARSVGLSPRQLERLFRQHLGQTPAAYAAGLRLDRARILLRETAMPVTAVGAACGYATPSRFSAAFRGRFGRPPNQERRQRAAIGAPNARQPHVP